MEIKIRRLTLEIDMDKVKSREQFLEMLDKILEYDFVSFYNDNNITGMLYKREKKKSGEKDGK